MQYKVDGLPKGVHLVGDRIHVDDYARPGQYTIRVRAVDEKGEVDEKIITLVILHHEVEAEEESTEEDNTEEEETSQRNMNKD